MRYRQLGSSDLEVSEISLGSWLTYGGGVEREHAEACVAAAFDVGINFIDTANVYAARPAPRSSSARCSTTGHASRTCSRRSSSSRCRTATAGSPGEQVLKQIDASLARLRTDYVDLYQCHRYDWDTPLEETMQALTEVVHAGKARYLGFSEWPAEKIQEALALADVEKFVSSQPQYSMIWRGPGARSLPALRRERHLADRLVAARAGHPHRASTSLASRRPRRAARRPKDELLHGPCRRRHPARARAASPARRRWARPLDGPARTRVGAARAERRVGDHRRITARAGDRQRRRLGRRARRFDARRDRRDPRRQRRI